MNAFKVVQLSLHVCTLCIVSAKHSPVVVIFVVFTVFFTVVFTVFFTVVFTEFFTVVFTVFFTVFFTAFFTSQCQSRMRYFRCTVIKFNTSRYSELGDRKLLKLLF